MKRFILLVAVGISLCHTQVECRRYPEGPRGPNRSHGGRNGRWGVGRGPAMEPCPTFLRNLTDEAYEEYFSIPMNENLTIAQINEEILKWGAKHNISMQLLEYKRSITLRRNEIRQNITQLISQLPSALQVFFSFVDNEKVTPVEHYELITNLTEQDPELFDTINYAAGLVLRKMYGSECGRVGAYGGYMPGFEAFGRDVGRNYLDCGFDMRGQNDKMSGGGGGYRWAGIDFSRKEDSWSMEDQGFMNRAGSRGMNRGGSMNNQWSMNKRRPSSEEWGDYGAYVGRRGRYSGNMGDYDYIIEF